MKRGIAYILLLIGLICLTATGCGNTDGTGTENEQDMHYECDQIDLPEGIDIIADMCFLDDAVYMVTDTKGKDDAHTIELFRGSYPGEDWDLVFQQTNEAIDGENVLEHSVSAQFSEGALTIVDYCSVGQDVQSSREKIERIELFDLEGKKLQDVVLPENADGEWDAETILLDQNGDGLATLKTDQDPASDTLSKIVSIHSDGTEEQLADNADSYEFYPLEDTIYADSVCYDLKSGKPVEAPVSLAALWEDLQKWYSEDQNLSSGCRYIWRPARTQGGEVEGIAMDQYGVYRFTEDGTKLTIGDAPGKLLGETKDYSYSNIHVLSAEDFYIPYNDGSYWGRLQLYHYTREDK